MKTVTPEALLFQLQAIATADYTEILRIVGGSLQIADTDSLSAAQRAAIASIEKGTGGIKLKLYDKLKALELLCKLLGLGEAALAPPDQTLLEAIEHSTGEVIDIHDIPELQQTAENSPLLVESEVHP